MFRKRLAYKIEKCVIDSLLAALTVTLNEVQDHFSYYVSKTKQIRPSPQIKPKPLRFRFFVIQGVVNRAADKTQRSISFTALDRNYRRRSCSFFIKKRGCRSDMHTLLAIVFMINLVSIKR